MKKKLLGALLVVAVAITKMKYVVLIILCTIMSCKQDDNKVVLLDLSKSSKLSILETLIDFDDKYPVSITIKDSLAFIIHVKSDSCIVVLDMENRKIISSLGAVGNGPEDVISPEFIMSLDNSNILLDDINTKKIMKINIDEKHNMFGLEQFINYPMHVYPSSTLNFSKNYITGRKIGMSEGKMFYIYDMINDSLAEIDFYPVIGNLVDPNYFYASNVALNEEKNRIIAGMYFFDMFHLYNLQGNRIKTFCFSEDWSPQIDIENKTIDLEKGYAGIVRLFPTNNYCYLLRLVVSPVVGNNQIMLIQTDWDGNLINSYKIEDKLEGQFYIDEKTNRMYTIRHDDEIFSVVSYQLN